jgi:hypothetical protein
MVNEMKYFRLYADSDGVSHFSDEVLGYTEIDYIPPAPPLNISDAQAVENLILMHAPAHWSEESRHPSPKKQWVFVLRGAVEYKASDGDSRTLKVGNILFTEDTFGDGHTARIVGDEEVLLALAQQGV